MIYHYDSANGDGRRSWVWSIFHGVRHMDKCGWSTYLCFTPAQWTFFMEKVPWERILNLSPISILELFRRFILQRYYSGYTLGLYPHSIIVIFPHNTRVVVSKWIAPVLREMIIPVILFYCILQRWKDKQDS